LASQRSTTQSQTFLSTSLHSTPWSALAGDKYRSPNFETFEQHMGLRVFSNDDMSILSTSGMSLDDAER